jgi:hypothetical protein
VGESERLRKRVELVTDANEELVKSNGELKSYMHACIRVACVSVYHQGWEPCSTLAACC